MSSTKLAPFFLLLLTVEAFAGTVPITLNFSGSAPNAQRFQPGPSAGILSPFGSATALLVYNQPRIAATFTIQDGSSFTADFTGSGAINSPVLSFEGTITGGTGIFKDATGSLSGAVTITNLSPSVPNLDYTVTGAGTITIPDAAGGLTVSPPGLTFALAQGRTAAQGIVVRNTGSAPAAFQAAAPTTSGGNWLSVSSSSGTVPPFGTSPLTVTVNAGQLKAGVYSGQVSIAFASSTLTVFVELAVGPAGVYLQLSQTALIFQGNPSGTPPPAQTVVVSNTGVGSLQGLTVTPSPLSGGSWLSATAVPAGANQVNVSVSANAKGLTPGRYFGRVIVSLAGSPNSALTVNVMFKVQEDIGGGYIGPPFVVFIKGESITPSPRDLKVINSGNVPLSYFSEVISYVGGGVTNWLRLSPASGTIPAGDPPAVMSFTPDFSVLPPGGYIADVKTHFNPDPFRYSDQFGVQVVVIVPQGFPAPFVFGASPEESTQREAFPGCLPTQLLAVAGSPSKAFRAKVGEPSLLDVLVVDNCGNLVNNGSVVATFASGGSPVILTPVGVGEWTGTWVPRRTASTETITIQAQTLTAPLLATVKTVTGTVEGNTEIPLISVNGVVNAASGTTTVSPGEFIAIYGSKLGSALTVTPAGQPFATTLGDTRVTLGGRVLPLYFSSNGQIDAIVPYDVPPNTRQQLIVESGGALSPPEEVTVVTAHPGVFTQDQSGKGPGAILVQKPGGAPSLNTASNPASAGDALLIFCTGLGTVSPGVPAGSPASVTSLSATDNPVSVKVGGQNAQVLFAGLAPGFAGLYQINVLVPAGLTASSSVPLVVTAAGVDSVPVTVAIR